MRFKEVSLSIGMKYSKYFTLLLDADGGVWGAGCNFFGQLGTGNRSDCVKAARTALNGVASVKAGNLHSVALTRDGSVLGFGLNMAGCLGGLPPGPNPIPKPIPELAGVNVNAIGAAGDFTFALSEEGTLYVLGGTGVKTIKGIGEIYPGANESYAKKSGDGYIKFENGKEPADVPEFDGMDIRGVSAGNAHICVLTGQGTVLCRGDNSKGQLGLPGGAENSPDFIDTGLTGIVSVTAGGSHSLALDGSGKVYAWGFNFFGQLGDGTGKDRLEPALINELPPSAFIAAGTFNSMAVSQAGDVYGWGSDDFGQLGDGVQSQIREPRLLEGFNVKKASAGLYHTALLTDDGKLYIAGCNLYGQLGYGRNGIGRHMPELFLTGVRDMEAGGTHTAAISEAGNVTAWGNDACGQIGSGRADINPDGKFGGGEFRNQPIPARVNLPGVKRMAAGENHTLYLTDAGEVYAAGFNNCGQLGDGSQHNSSIPLKINGLKNIKEIHAHKFRNTALDADGRLYGWGFNGNGELGTGDDKPRLIPEVIMDGVEKVVMGGWYTLVVKKDATVWAFGMNMDGQFGDGTNKGSLSPREVTSFYGEFKDITAGGFHTVALRHDGTVWTCGKNEFGELGAGAPMSRNLLSPVPGLNDIEKIAAGWFCTFAITKGGGMYRTGRNNFGQLFSPDTNRYRPVKMEGDSL